LPKLKAVELTAEMGPQTLDRLAQMLLALSTPEKAALQALVTTNGHAASLPLPHEE
jgi:hypothetical protein